MTEQTENTPIKSLTGSRLLARNTVWNFIGMAAPTLVAVFSIPLLIQGLGTDRFGVLTLAWLVIGYFGLFDMGLGRALTKLVAEKLGAAEQQEIPALFWTSLSLMFVLGLVGTVIVALISHWLVYDILQIPEELQSETLYAFVLLSVSLPVITSTTGLWGVLEAYQRFGFTSTVRIFHGTITYIGPLVALLFSQSLFIVVAVLLIGRLASWLCYLLLCFYTIPPLRQRIVFQRSKVWPLITFGGWMTVSNILSPIMVYSDRFIVGSLISAAAVAYYVTPAEMVVKLLVFPNALVGVLFPAFAASFLKDKNRTAFLFGQGCKYIFLTLFPVALIVVTLANEGLTLWLGPEFALNSTRVLQWLTIGIFINSLAHFPSALVQGAGRPDLSAKLHLFELPIYLIIVWWMTKTFGIEGTAIAWMIRALIDGVILLTFVKMLLPTSSNSIKQLLFSGGVTIPILILLTLPQELATRGSICVIILSVFAVSTWYLILSEEERSLIKHQVSHSRLLLAKAMKYSLGFL